MEYWNIGIMGKDVTSCELRVNPLRLATYDSLLISAAVLCAKNKGKRGKEKG
jgi:hypothetical protein